MNAFRTLRCVAALLALSAAAAWAAGPEWDPRRIPVPPLHPVQAVKPQRFTLPNGAVVFLLENHELPQVQGIAYFKMGPALVPDDKVGLASVTGEVMRSGGTVAHPGDALDERLASIGASISSSVGSDMANGGFRCLSDNSAEVVRLWGEVLRAPAFPQDKIELSKVGLRRSIASRNDEMLPLLFRVARESVYGPGNPYGRKPEYATVEAITRDDLTRLHDAVFVPERMVLAVYGDFRTADMKRLLTGAFGSWRRSGTPEPTAGPAAPPPTPRLMFAPKDDVTQSGLVLAEPGSRADDPDYAALQVLEQALGGGFQSRLFNRIRTQRGLAYAAGSTSGADFQRPGVFYAYALTRSDSAMVSLDLLREEVARVTKEPLTGPELEGAKRAVLNGFVFNFEDPAQVLFRAAFYEITGYPLDFLERYQKAVTAVDAGAVLAAARRKLHPDRQIAIVVGREQEFDRPLTALGLPLERVDLAIPPPGGRKSSTMPADPAAQARGRELLAKAAAQAGGPNAWRAVKSVVVEQAGSLTLQGQTLEFTAVRSWLLPDRQLTVQTLPMGEIRRGVDGTAGWTSMMGQLQDDPRARQAVAQDFERSLFHLFGAPDLKVTALGEPRVVDGAGYAVARVESEAVQDLELLFAPDGTLARIEWQGSGPQGPAHMTQVLSDWKPVGALRYPHASTTLVDGERQSQVRIASVKLDPVLDPAMFRKPAP